MNRRKYYLCFVICLVYDLTQIEIDERCSLSNKAEKADKQSKRLHSQHFIQDSFQTLLDAFRTVSLNSLLGQ